MIYYFTYHFNIFEMVYHFNKISKEYRLRALFSIPYRPSREGVFNLKTPTSSLYLIKMIARNLLASDEILLSYLILRDSA